MTPRDLEIAATVGEWKPLTESDQVERDGYRLYIGNGNTNDPEVVAEGTVNGQRAIIGYMDGETIPFCYKP